MKFKVVSALTDEQKVLLKECLDAIEKIETNVCRVSAGIDWTEHRERADFGYEICRETDRPKRMIKEVYENGGWGEYIQSNDDRQRLIGAFQKEIDRLKEDMVEE